ncbi:MAG: PAS domain-containing protein [Desulfomonilaceae bacterium]
MAQEVANAGTWEWDLRTNKGYRSEELWHLYGLDPDTCDAGHDSWINLMHPDDRDRARNLVHEALSKFVDMDFEWRLHKPDGTDRWFLSRGKPVFDSEGHAIRYIGIAIDITERKRNEEALRQSEERYSLLFQSLRDLINLHSGEFQSEFAPALLRTLPDVSKDLQYNYIENALRKTRGKVQPAAKLLGVSRFALMRQMARLGINPHDYK